ncbi:coadhesin-like [Sycon ciliatum]|uniref:coadhesin-like n=1 Tax=Sycon ciliatum TaxID=27933 RepID=UPI0031F67CD6
MAGPISTISPHASPVYLLMVHGQTGRATGDVQVCQEEFARNGATAPVLIHHQPMEELSALESHSSFRLAVVPWMVDGQHGWHKERVHGRHGHHSASVARRAGGTKTRRRTCSSPSPAHGGYNCSGFSADTRNCSLPCPIHGGWSSWSSYTQCSKTCQGTQQRTRFCTNPPPANSGAGCTGAPTDIRICGATYCPVDGKWSTWSPYSACSATCEGSKTRSRSCTDPAPVYLGAECQGIATEHAICGEAHCPIDGKWSAWSRYGACSGTCEGYQTRKRNCSNPPPAHKGLPCQGKSSTQQQRCGRSHCPVEGGWSQWSPIMSACSAGCGTGSRTLRRYCNMPEPRYGGLNCSGEGERNESCFSRKCTEVSTVSSESQRNSTTKGGDLHPGSSPMEPAQGESSQINKWSRSTFVGLGVSVGVTILLSTVALTLWKMNKLPVRTCLAENREDGDLELRNEFGSNQDAPVLDLNTPTSMEANEAYESCGVATSDAYGCVDLRVNQVLGDKSETGGARESESITEGEYAFIHGELELRNESSFNHRAPDSDQNIRTSLEANEAYESCGLARNDAYGCVDLRLNEMLGGNSETGGLGESESTTEGDYTYIRNL